jgi:hypothetical protein
MGPRDVIASHTSNHEVKRFSDCRGSSHCWEEKLLITGDSTQIRLRSHISSTCARKHQQRPGYATQNVNSPTDETFLLYFASTKQVLVGIYTYPNQKFISEYQNQRRKLTCNQFFLPFHSIGVVQYFPSSAILSKPPNLRSSLLSTTLYSPASSIPIL